MRWASLFGCLFLTGGSFLANAFDFKPQFEVGPQLTWGTATELVLRDGTYSNPISRLQWPVTPGMGLSFRAGLPWAPWTSTEFGLSSVWPLAVGVVVDEDWNATTDTGGTLTYGKSSHTGMLTAHISASAEQQFHWGDGTISLGGLYRWTSWEAWNGTGEYHYPSGSSSSYQFSGLVLSYEQRWIIPYLAAGWTVHWIGATFHPSVRFSPYTWCFDTDNHFYAGTYTKTFLDTVRGGYYIRPSLDLSWRVGAAEFGIRGAFDLAWGATGDTITTNNVQSGLGNTASYPQATNSAGAWFYEASLSFFVRN